MTATVSEQFQLFYMSKITCFPVNIPISNTKHTARPYHAPQLAELQTGITLHVFSLTIFSSNTGSFIALNLLNSLETKASSVRQRSNSTFRTGFEGHIGIKSCWYWHTALWILFFLSTHSNRDIYTKVSGHLIRSEIPLVQWPGNKPCLQKIKLHTQNLKIVCMYLCMCFAQFFLKSEAIRNIILFLSNKVRVIWGRKKYSNYCL